MRSILLSVWNTWKKITHFIALIQSRILLTICYFILFLPVGTLFTTIKDELGVKKKRTSQWRKVEKNHSAITDLQRQY